MNDERREHGTVSESSLKRIQQSYIDCEEKLES